ncbi:MAG: Ig-like domain-containing protein [bacterium]|nr:Ig-like domain-containing protein [bacterium]
MSLSGSILSLPTLLMLAATPATDLGDPTDTAQGALPMQPRGAMAPSTTPAGSGDFDGPNHTMGLGDKILFVNFDGADMNPCNSGPQNNCSGLFFGTVLPYTGDAAKRASVIQIVRTRVNDFGITVTDTRPASGDYDMEMVGDWAGVGDQGFAGVAPGPVDCFDNRGGEVSFTLEASTSSDGIAEIILQEVAHTWGLEHIDDQGDLLYPTTQGQNKIFKDECLQIVVLNDNGSTSPTGAYCGSQHAQFCSGNQQNSYQEMLALFGPGIPDTTAPTVQIVSPADGDSVEGDVNLVVSFEDDQSPMIVNATITIESASLEAPVESDGAYAAPSELEFPIQGLPGGEYTVTIDATDEDDNPTSDSVTFTVVGDPPSDTAGSGGGDESGGEETSGGGTDGGEDDGGGGNDDDGGGNDDGGPASAGDTDGSAGGDGDGGGCSVDTPGSKMRWAVLGLIGLLAFRRRD